MTYRISANLIFLNFFINQTMDIFIVPFRSTLNQQKKQNKCVIAFYETPSRKFNDFGLSKLLMLAPLALVIRFSLILELFQIKFSIRLLLKGSAVGCKKINSAYFTDEHFLSFFIFPYYINKLFFFLKRRPRITVFIMLGKHKSNRVVSHRLPYY